MTIPGGFTYGDDVAAGKILAVQLQHFLGDVLRSFRDKERLILGICNGFQVLLKAGLIVPPDLDEGPIATLTHNVSGKFDDRWIHLEATPGKCPFLKGYQRLHLPIAHGEGNFICTQEWILKGLFQAGQIVLRYTPSPLAGLRKRTARSVACASGLPVPHQSKWFARRRGRRVRSNGSRFGPDAAPGCHVLPTQHPQWTRHGLAPEGDGLRLFRNAVEFFQ